MPPESTPAAAPAAATPAAAPAAKSVEMTLEQIQESIAGAVTKALKAEHPKHEAQITEAGVKAIIAAELKKFEADSKAVTKDNIGELVNNTIAEQVKSLRKEKAVVADPGDADRGVAGKQAVGVEIPSSWTKGNLPLHGKQLLNLMQRKGMNDGIPESMLTKGLALGDGTLSRMAAQAKMLEHYGHKALTSTGSATGDELVPTDLSAELLRRFFLASNLAAVFMANEIQMPTQPYQLPLSTTRPQFYGESTENTAATESTPGTGAPTLTAVRFVGETDFSYELDEDSIIAILPMLMQLMAEGGADAWEDALINGDTTGTHQDTDTAAGSAKLPAKFVKGFRKLALAISGLKTDLSSGGVGTNANFLAVRKLLKKYGGNPNNLIWVASPTTAIAMQAISEVVSLEKFGSRATIITGEIAALQGIPIIQSEQVREDVDATGVNGASGNTKSTVLCVNKTRFLTGYRRQLQIEVDKNIQSGKNMVVASFRKAFTPIEVPSASITSVGIGYNFTP